MARHLGARFGLEGLEGRRLFAGVSVDPSFGGGRYVIDTATAANLRNDTASAMALQQDGKIVVGDSNGAATLVRLNEDGTLDTSFGDNGLVSLRFTGDTQIAAVRLLPDGKLLVAGTVYGNGGFVARLTADGSLDASFGTGGTTRNAAGTVQDMIVLPDGSLLVTGLTHAPSYTTGDWDSYGAAVRLKADGSLDPSFGTGGSVSANQGTYNQYLGRLIQVSPTKVLAVTSVGLAAIDLSAGTIGPRIVLNSLSPTQMLSITGGKVMAIGQYYNNSTGQTYAAMFRLTGSGALDTTFGQNGTLQLAQNSFGVSYTATSFVPLADGSYHVWVSAVGGPASPTLLHVSADGSIDQTFNQTGSFTDPITASLGYGATSPVVKTVLDSQGRMITAMVDRYGPSPDGGNSSDNIVITRIVTEMGITPSINVTTGALTEGNAFGVSAQGTLAQGLPIVKYEWDADYPKIGGIFNVDASGIDATLQALRSPTQQIALRVTTSDGASAIFTKTLNVANVVPTITAGPAVVRNISDNFAFNFTVTDPGVEPKTLTIDKGDGSAVLTIANWTPGVPVTTAYSHSGTFTATFTVTDPDGASASDIQSVTILPLRGKVIDASHGDAAMSGVTVFVDADRDGAFDNGEYNTVTDSAGAFTIPDSYINPVYAVQVGVVPPDDYSFAGQTADLQVSPQLASYSSWQGFSIRLAQQAGVSGRVFTDQNLDGVGESAFSTRVFADLNDNGVFDTGDLITTADTAGQFSFDLPGAGHYAVGIVPSPDLQFGDAAVVSFDLTQFGRKTGVVLLAKKLQAGSISFNAFLDADGDGLQGVGEPGVPALTGQLTYADYPQYPAKAFTLYVDGGYAYSDLPPGKVAIALDLAPNYNYAAGLDLTSVVAAGQTATLNIPLHYAQPLGTISGFVYADRNADHSYQPGEPTYVLTPYVDLNDNGQFDAGEPKGYFSGSTYTILAVPPGTHTVRVVEQYGFVNSLVTTADVVAGGAITNVDLPVVNTNPLPPYAASITGPTQIAEGQVTQLVGYGQWHNVMLAGFEWDLDYDGQSFHVDATGNPLAFGDGVDGPSVHTIAGRSYDSDGRRSDIAIITIRVVNAAPTATVVGDTVAIGKSNTVQVTAADPSVADRAALKYSYDFNNDGDFTDAGDVLNSSLTQSSYRFGAVGTYPVHVRVTDRDGAFSDYTTTVQVVPPPPASLAGVVYYDANGNGKKEASDRALANAVIYNDANNNGVFDNGEAFTLTDAAGNYKLDNVAFGTYRLRAVLPSGYKTAVPNVNLYTGTIEAGQNGTGKNFVAALSTLVIDDAQAVKTGTWSPSTTSAGFNGVGYLTDGNTAKGAKSITFTPTILGTGMYKVLVRWPAGTNRATNVPIDIKSAEGTRTVTVNQTLYNNTWVSLGTYTFNAGTGGSVTIRTTGTNGYVIADAVEFVPVPDIVVDNTQATTTGIWTTSTTSTVRVGDNYLSDGNAGGGKRVTYTPYIATAGTYAVYGWWEAGAGRATNALFDILHSGATDTVSVDQSVNGSRWVLLGTYAFDAGTAGSITLRDDGANGVVIADAVRLVKV